MMALLWDTAFFFTCVQHSTQGSLFQVGPLRFREVSYLVLVHPQPGSRDARTAGAGQTWSSLQFLVRVCGTEIKGCWSGLSLLILLYSDRLLCLSC